MNFRAERQNPKSTFRSKVLANDMAIANEPLIVVWDFKDNQPSPWATTTALQNLAALTSAIQNATAVHEAVAVLA